MSGASLVHARVTSSARAASPTCTMSPRSTTAASTSCPNRSSPACSDVLVGPVKLGLSAISTGRSARTARARSASWPSTTTTGDSPAVSARRTARRTSGSPSSSSSLLFRPGPMRREAPAASTTPATRSGLVRRGMNGREPLAERPRSPAGAHREHLREHGHRHLFGAVGPDVEAHGPVHTPLVHWALRGEVAQHPISALAGAQHADVGDRRLQERAQVRLIVGEVVVHHDGVALDVERYRSPQLVARAPHQRRSAREPLAREPPGPPTDDP